MKRTRARLGAASLTADNQTKDFALSKEAQR